MSTTETLVTVLLGAVLVATAAAVRSTWSPCGLSMLSTITPATERARGHSYRATATWFVAGAALGGASLGALMAVVALGVHLAGASSSTRLWLAGAAALVALASDSRAFGRQLPVHRRQVNERWLDEFRAWVYGGGFGWQIGTGVVTYITSAAVYLTIVLGVLTATPAAALAVGVWFGFLRGLAVLLTARVQSPAALLSFHRRFEAVRPWADRAVRAAETVVVLGVAPALGFGWPGVAVAVAGLGVAVRIATRPRDPARVGGPGGRVASARLAPRRVTSSGQPTRASTS